MTESHRLPSRPIDFQLGASVQTSDGHHVGTLQRIVVDADDLALFLRITPEDVRPNPEPPVRAGGDP